MSPFRTLSTLFLWGVLLAHSTVSLGVSCTPPTTAGATGRIIYVAPTVPAAGSCSQVATHASIAAALSVAEPDDVIRLLPGTFNENVTFPRGGAVGHPITLTYTPAEVCANGGMHSAVLDCNNRGENCLDASYGNLLIDGLEVKNAVYNGIKVDGDVHGSLTTYPADSAYGYYSYGNSGGYNDRNYYVNGADNVVIRNNKVHHVGADGLKIGHANHIYLLNNEIYRAGTGGTQQGIDMVGVYDSAICGNYIHDESNPEWGARSMNKGIFDKGGSQNILIENNVIKDMESPEACLEVGGDTEWYNTRYDHQLVNDFSASDPNSNINAQILAASDTSNPIDLAASYIPSLMSESRHAVVRGNLLVNCDPALSFRNTYGAKVYNNTVINSGWSQAWVKLWDDGVDGGAVNEANHINLKLSLFNNLMANNSVPLRENGVINDKYGILASDGLVFENNLLNDNNDTALPPLGASFLDPSKQRVGNPLLDAAYKPMTGSPVIDSGADLLALGVVSAPFMDAYGVARPSGNAFDIGAYEYSSASPALTPSATSLTCAPASASLGQAVNCTATVSSASGTPGGTVRFAEGASTLGNVSLSAGLAHYSGGLPLGIHNLTAIYAGDATYGASTSAVQTVTVTAAASTNADLGGLSATGVVFSPAFSSGILNYSASVENGVASISLTPQVVESHASVRINGALVASGSASGNIPLNVGENLIPILVTAQDAVTTRSYSLNVTRSALLPTVSFTASTLSVPEQIGVATVTVSRSHTSGAVTAYFGTSPGSASAGNDYAAVSGSLSWNDGESGNKSIDVAINNDTGNEGDETFNVTLTGLTGALLGLASQTITILDDDVAEPPPPPPSGYGILHAGTNHSYAVTPAGTLWAWGGNNYGQLADGTRKGRITPSPVSGMDQLKSLSAGYANAFALKRDGSLWSWGWNVAGQLGLGYARPYFVKTPQQVTAISHIASIAAATNYTAALKTDGTVWAWGMNGAEDPESGNSYLIPTQIAGLDHVAAITAGGAFVLALKEDGTVWAWGSNPYGQLGDGTVTKHAEPAVIVGLSDIVELAAGENHALALKADGSVWAWGFNKYGQLGDNSKLDRSMPVKVSGLTDVIEIVASQSGDFSMAIRSDGVIWTWGRNHYGQLGDGSYTNRKAPVQVSGLSGVTSLAAGGEHAIALRQDGSVWGWGRNNQNQLGLPVGDKLANPVPLPLNVAGQ